MPIKGLKLAHVRYRLTPDLEHFMSFQRANRYLAWLLAQMQLVFSWNLSTEESQGGNRAQG